GRQLQIGELQQLDRLLQLRRHDERLGLPQIEPLRERHDERLYPEAGHSCKYRANSLTERKVAPPARRNACISRLIWRARRAGAAPSEAEFLAEIDAAHIDVGDDLRRRAFHQHAALMEDVGAVDDVEGLAHI